jgi:dTDP-4-dehydrorhamnose reductase
MGIELWAGPECTVNRIGNRYFDQVERTGHDQRLDDLDHFASLGIRSLRYPVLWERTLRDGQPDWDWSDERLNRLRDLRIEPIVGLLHHGSGPRWTSLVDPEFPEKFRQYARSVAQRYPWVESYTPINEPLTTARFSCLYGHWYPHKKDVNSFVRALLLQCKAVVLGMKEIRLENPRARLIQTEDFGKVFSTAKMAYQADFENCRRWSTWDLLNGKIEASHVMFSHFRWAGIPESEILWFQDNPCPPDILGLNHYVTSDRYIDENLGDYPKNVWGTNGQNHYADVEAVRALDSYELGPERRIAEVWQRYHRPLAITEAHLGCVETIQQVLWFREVWDAARLQNQRGADIRAVTAWSLLGAFDWDTLLTRQVGHYERGVFEIGHGKIHATPLAHVLREMAHGIYGNRDDSARYESGWWRRPERICYPCEPDRLQLSSKV